MSDDLEPVEAVIYPDDVPQTGLLLAGLIRTCGTAQISEWEKVLDTLRGHLDDRKAMNDGNPPRLKVAPERFVLFLSERHGSFGAPYIAPTCDRCGEPFSDGEVAILANPDEYDDIVVQLARAEYFNDEDPLGLARLTTVGLCTGCVFGETLHEPSPEAHLAHARDVGVPATRLRAQTIPTVD